MILTKLSADKLQLPHILIISAVFPPEPVVSASLSRDIAEELSKNNYVTVLCPHPSRPKGFRFDDNFSPGNYNVVHLNSYTCASSKLFGRFRESYSFGKHCAKYLSDSAKKVDCIYANSWPLLSQYCIVKAAKQKEIPCIIHIQDIYPESMANKLPAFLKSIFTATFFRIDKFVLANATKIIGISQNVITHLSGSRKVNQNKFVLIRNWQNDSLFVNYIPPDVLKKDFVFMYVGSISPTSAVTALIDSFHLANLPGAVLKIAGAGSDKEKCIEMVGRSGNTNIEFYDASPGSIPELQSQADVLILSLRKGISLTATPSKLTAYLLSAKPVLACVEKESDVTCVIKDADCGFVVEPENIESLVFAMKQVYSMEKAVLEKLGANGRNYALLHLSRKINLQKLISVIENTISWK